MKKLTDEQRANLYEAWKDGSSNEVELEVRRSHIEPGRSFSSEALDELHSQILIFIGARVMARWNQSGEPPSALKVTLRVEAQ